MCGLRILLGLFEGVTYPATFTFISPYLKSADHGSATAYINMGASVGAIFAFAVTPAIVHHLGWEAVFSVFGLLGLAVAAAWALFAVEKDPRCASQLSPPKPDGAATTATAVGSLAVTFSALWAMVQSRSVLAIVYCGFVQAFGGFMLLSWLPTILHELFDADGLDLWLSSLPFFGAIGGAYFGGQISDRLTQSRASALQARIIVNGALLAQSVRPKLSCPPPPPPPPPRSVCLILKNSLQRRRRTGGGLRNPDSINFGRAEDCSWCWGVSWAIYGADGHMLMSS